jgi:transcriptional regulator NrdR family protein
MAGAIKCPSCGTLNTKVKDSRPEITRSTVRRKRECVNCGRRWFTLELEEDAVRRMEVALDPRVNPPANNI